MDQIFQRLGRSFENQATKSHRGSMYDARTERPLLILMIVLGCAIYACAGFAGLGILGLVILFISLQLDIDNEPFPTSSVARQFALHDLNPKMRSLAAERLEQIATTSRFLRVAKFLGLGLAIVGIGARLI